MSDPQDAPLASLGLLRRLTDRHVIDQLLGVESMTRAELAALTGISKPTISESIRRLTADGVVTEAGYAAAARRGPAGVNYALRPDLGTALALAAGPDGITAEVLDVKGQILRRVDHDVPSPVTAADLEPRLLALVDEALRELTGPLRACSVSLAGPVDRASGRLRHFPHSPFLVDELDVRRLLAARIEAPIQVDNDVNWAALAELHTGGESEDFCYLHLGYGLGGALIRGGQLVHGHTGVAGEPAQMITVGPGGRAMRLVECFGELGLLRTGSDTIDVERVAGCFESDDDEPTQDAIVAAVTGTVATMAALLNPARIVIGGPWASAGRFPAALQQAAMALVVPPTPVVMASLQAAPLVGARLAAVDQLRSIVRGSDS